MRVVAVIPARWASTRFPGKPLAMIHGKEMIRWVIEGVSKSPWIDDVWVATDDDRIAECVTTKCANIQSEKGQRRVNVAMTDPSLPSGTDRAWKVIETASVDCDIVVNVQGDEPMIQAQVFEPLLAPFLNSTEDFSEGFFRDSKQTQQIELSTLAQNFRNREEFFSKNVVKVITNDQSYALYFSRFPIPYSRQEPPIEGVAIPGVFKHIGIYAFRKSFLKSFCERAPGLLEKAESLEQLRALEMGARIFVGKLETYESVGVDVPEDIAKVEKLLQERTQ